MKSKELFRALFQQQEVSRPLYIPLIGSFAARVRQAPVSAMFSNPTLYANSLRDAARLFGFDALVTSFDPSLAAEALGCEIQWERENQLPRVASHPLLEGREPADLDPKWEEKGRIPVVLEVTRRLTTLLSKEVAILGTMTGPFTLAGQLRGEAFFAALKEDPASCTELLHFAVQCSVKLARYYADLQVDGLILIEDHFYRIGDPSAVKKLALELQPFSNLLNYFGIPLIFLAHGCRKEQIGSLATLPANGFILDVQPDQKSPDQGRCIAATIPTEILLNDTTRIREVLDRLLESGRLFISNDWEIPYHTPVQNIHAIMKGIKNRNCSGG